MAPVADALNRGQPMLAKSSLRTDPTVVSMLEPHRKRLWRICYRMTGVSADADELVQDTFMRALTAPPADLARELGPWLTRVAINAAHDRLRKRKHERYLGPWLPSPLELDTLLDDAPSASARYLERESMSYAFLLALETLTPQQRAIVILRDVLDYSVRETASVLSLSEGNVKTSHHRARAMLESYDAGREVAASADALSRSRAAMTRLFAHVALGDMASIERLFAADAVGLNDGADEFFAAKRPIVRPGKIARFYLRLSGKMRVLRAEPCELSGLPAVYIEQVVWSEGVPPRVVNLFDADVSGQITAVYSVMATRKLSGLTLC